MAKFGDQRGGYCTFRKPVNASIDELVGLVAADMERVNATILSRTGSEVTMIPEVANHLISSGGKRLRPMLTLAMANLTGYSGDGHIKLAASVEFMHTATLLHDDVVDESELRRGKLSARMLWGNEASVLVGDFLLGQAFRMMVEVGSLRALDILSSAAATIAEGEVMQLAAAKNTATTEDEYLAVIRGKTAELFAAACEVGPVIANRPKAEQTACRSVGMNLGIAFQLVDDVLDYGGKAAKLGKNIGDDFREGKITLPVVLAFRRGNDSERAFWIKALERGEIGDSDLDHAIGLMTKHRALEDTISRAQHYGAMAVDALALFPASPMKIGAGAGGGVLPGTVALTSCVGWVERSDTHRLAGSIDGYRFAPPILRRRSSRMTGTNFSLFLLAALVIAAFPAPASSMSRRERCRAAARPASPRRSEPRWAGWCM